MILSAEKVMWHQAATIEDVPENGGTCIRYKDEQIAIFYFKKKNEYYATQNMCPHKKQMILSRGMTGDKNGEPKVACPYHKKNFSLTTGECLSDDECDSIKTYPVKVENGFVYVGIISE
jgi:nitrite reductase (NADH) small subunit